MKIAVLVVVVVCAALLVSQPTPKEIVGPQPDGTVLLNSGWRLKPAGEIVPLSTFPMASVLTPSGRYLLVLHGGYLPPSVSVLDAKSLKPVSSAPAPDGWLGLAITADGRSVYVGGGSRASVFEFSLSDSGQLAAARTLEIVKAPQRQHQDFIGDVALSPDGRFLYAAILHRDEIAVINRSTGVIIERLKTGRRPYRILFHPDGQSFFVSSWADAAIYHHKSETGERLGMLRVGPHPTDMVWRDKPVAAEEEGEKPDWQARIFVAAANTNNVYVAGVTADKSLRIIETLNVSMTPNQPAGMTPSALALNADQSKLYTVCSDANAVAVADVSRAKSNMLGFIPTGWYPTAARVLPDGRVFIMNGRGARSYPNPNGPQPGKAAAVSHEGIRNAGYVGNLQLGNANVVAGDYLDSATVLANSPYRDTLLTQTVAFNNVVPANPETKSPIEHVIYVVKENRTYDQVFGDLGIGNGDPSLTLFGEDVAPNHRKLARDYVLFDNFYVNADVSADGHNWSTAAIAPDYVQKLWPNSYGGRRRHYDYEGGEPAALPPGGRIWNAVLQKGLSLRNYGWWTQNTPQAAPAGQNQTAEIRDPALVPFTNRNFRGFDMDYADVERIKVFLTDLAQFEKDGKMPNFMMVRIGNDHTSGTAPGKISPKGAMADNDLALGMLVEAVSKSRFWAKTAIFVLEDDAQNGPDHVDSHRSPAFVISPYTYKRGIDSHLYNTAAMLRTMELLLGLRPMTHFDAAARPMAAAFGPVANTTPYTLVRPKHPLDERNPASAPGARQSAQMDFEEADRIDDDELNDILWRAIKGTEPPAPRRSVFGR